MTTLQISWSECKYMICRQYGLKDFALKKKNGTEWKRDPVYIEGDKKANFVQED